MWARETLDHIVVTFEDHATMIDSLHDSLADVHHGITNNDAPLEELLPSSDRKATKLDRWLDNMNRTEAVIINMQTYLSRRSEDFWNRALEHRLENDLGLTVIYCPLCAKTDRSWLCVFRLEVLQAAVGPWRLNLLLWPLKRDIWLWFGTAALLYDSSECLSVNAGNYEEVVLNWVPC